MSNNSVFDVAAYLIEKAKGSRPKDLTPLKLQKILYYAQGCYLAEKNEPLFDSPIFAWKYGPVVQKVYNYYKSHPTTHITPSEVPSSANPNALGEDVHKFLDTIWKIYGRKSAWELVGMTHVTQPWIDAFADPTSDEITIDEMRSYFASLK